MSKYGSDSAETETLADACLTYVIANPEELANFMGHAGIDGDALRKSIGTRNLALGLFDYFAQNESALLAMCANAGISAERFMRMWHRLNPDQ